MPLEMGRHCFERQQDAVVTVPEEDTESHLQLSTAFDSYHNQQSYRESHIKHLLKKLAFKNRKNPHRKLFVAAIKRRFRNEYPAGSWMDKLQDMIFIASIYFFDTLTPLRRSGHLLWFTSTAMLVTMVVFAFMAGAFPLYRFQKGYEVDANRLGWSPVELRDWATVRDNSTRFDFEYLLGWGGRYLPCIKEGDSYRWFTSILLHQSFVHLLSNALIFVFLGSYLEYKYGSFRIAVVSILAGLGGNLLSAVAEDQCSIVVGGSGVVFGFMGFGMVDLMLNQEAMLHAALRLVILILFLIFIIMTLALEEYSSHISHAGGFLCGFFPALLFAPALKYERAEAMVVWAAAGFLVLFFSLLPIVIYTGVLPALEC